MKSGLVIPRFYDSEALNGAKVDMAIKSIVEYVNGGLTGEAIAPSTTMGTGYFYENRTPFTVTLPLSTNSLATTPIGLAATCGFIANFTARILSCSIALRIVQTSSDLTVLGSVLVAGTGITLPVKLPVKPVYLDNIPDPNTLGWLPANNLYAGQYGNSWIFETFVYDRTAVVVSSGQYMQFYLSSSTSVSNITGSVTFTLAALHSS